MTSYKPAYDSDRVRQVFGNLSIDKARLPSSGLTKIGVPALSLSGCWIKLCLVMDH